MSRQSSSQFFSTLSQAELFWRSRSRFLERNGYRLRPRYREDWIPSWTRSLNPPHSFFSIEDACCLPARRGLFIDATRLSDGMLVYMKQVPTDSKEISFLRYLSSAQLRRDPRNHSVPLLDVLQDELDPNNSYIVMPFLRRLDSPEFQTVGEFLDFVSQMLEGLAFLHEHGVAHRDCADLNVMLDATPMYPNGFHPVMTGSLPDLSGVAWPVPRSSTSVKYYFTDFGISSFIPPDHPEKLAEGDWGLDREPPELHSQAPYDPFKLDVFILGNLFRRKFYDIYSNLGFLSPLIRKMTQPNPSNRPDASRALAEWRVIEAGVSSITRNWRLRKNDDSIPVQLAMDVYGALKWGLSSTRIRQFM